MKLIFSTLTDMKKLTPNPMECDRVSGWRFLGVVLYTEV